jgi:predicted aldo/keto reductase-like oxidoreductase
MLKKSKKAEQKAMIEDIKDQLSEGVELRDIAAYYGMSCRAICRLMAEKPEEDLDVLDLSDFDLGEPLEADNLKFEYD